MPRALIVAGRWIADPALTETGLAVLDWLVRTAVAPGGHLSPVGNRGWWRAGESRAQFDQQPIEAISYIHASEAALEATGDLRHLSRRRSGPSAGTWAGTTSGWSSRTPSVAAVTTAWAARPQPQPGCRVHARVAGGRGAHPGDARPLVYDPASALAVDRRDRPRRRSSVGQLST